MRKYEPRHNFWCADCGRRMFRGPGSLPQGQARCQECRRAVPAHGGKKSPCADCGQPSYGQRCRTCSDKIPRLPRFRSDDDRRTRRRDREAAAPGLSRSARSGLLEAWRKAGRPCAYCPDLADTIDHVVPLVRGGTNYEGNLVPCCRSCNGSKGGRTVAEWRHRRRPSRSFSLMPWMSPPAPKQRVVLLSWDDPAPLFCICPCGAVHQRRSEFCSQGCQARTIYRRKVGIPDDASLYRRAGQSPGDAPRAA